LQYKKACQSFIANSKELLSTKLLIAKQLKTTLFHPEKVKIKKGTTFY